MLLVTESIYPFSHASFRWSTRFARDDRPSFLFFLLSLPLPFVLTGGQRDILLLFCLFVSISLRIPWAKSNTIGRKFRVRSFSRRASRTSILSLLKRPRIRTPF